MPSTLISNPYEQWVHNYLIVASEPTYKLQQGYCEYVSYEAHKRGLYTIPKPDNRTIAQEGWLNFVKGIMSIYTITDFRSACSKAKKVLCNPQELKKDLDLWATPRQAEREAQEQSKKKAEAIQCVQTATLELLRKEVENAEKKESRAHDDLWMAEANEEEAIADYDRMKKDLEQQEEIMKEMIQARKDADKAYVAAQKNVEGCKKSLELVLAANQPTPNPTPTPSCDLPFTDGAFKSLKPCKATLVPGTYYIGDPCYPLGDSWIYKKAWDASGYKAPAYFHTEKGAIVVAATAWGDGTYHEHHEAKGEKTREYLVDSATISIISVALIHDEVERQKKECTKPETFKSLVKGGHIHTFDEEVDVHFKHGNFEFYSDCVAFNIDTDGCETCRQETEDEDDE